MDKCEREEILELGDQQRSSEQENVHRLSRKGVHIDSNQTYVEKVGYSFKYIWKYANKDIVNS